MERLERRTAPGNLRDLIMLGLSGAMNGLAVDGLVVTPQVPRCPRTLSPCRSCSRPRTRVRSRTRSRTRSPTRSPRRSPSPSRPASRRSNRNSSSASTHPSMPDLTSSDRGTSSSPDRSVPN